MTSSFFPDVNVWLAGSHASHVHHSRAARWFDSLPHKETIVFCRETQAGFLRLLTTRAGMGEYVTTQRGAWQVLDDLLLGHNVTFLPEPEGCWDLFRGRTERDQVSPKHWADAYLAAFASSAGVRLVTFDRALAASVSDPVLLTA